MANSSKSKSKRSSNKSRIKSKSSSKSSELRNNRKINKKLVNMLLFLCISVVLIIIYALFLNNKYCNKGYDNNVNFVKLSRNNNYKNSNNNINNNNSNNYNNNNLNTFHQTLDNTQRNNLNNLNNLSQLDDKKVKFDLNNNDVILISKLDNLIKNNNSSECNLGLLKSKSKNKTILKNKDNNDIHIHNHVYTAHPELNGLRSSNAKDNPNNISVWNHLNQKNHERIINPLLPPERSYENTYGIPINVPSRGYSRGYQQVGLLYKKDGVTGERQVGNDTVSNILPLFGQAVYPGSNKFNYYVTSDKFNNIKMPFTMGNGKKSDDTHGVDELQDQQELYLEEYNSNFVVKIYRLDKPRYIPHIL